MTPSPRLWIAIGAFYGGTAVGLGAYAHHGLEAEQYLVDSFQTGVTYQMWHALALVGVGFLATREAFATSKMLACAGGLFAIGVLLFSGTLYAFGFTADVPVLGAAPAGGMAMMGGWTCLLIAVLLGWRENR